MNLEGKQFEVLKWILVALALFLIFKTLNKLGVLGMTDDEKGAEELEDKKRLETLTLDKKTQDVIIKTTSKEKPTAADIKKLTPNSGSFAKWILDIKYAKGTVNDDEDTVFNVFRSMSSQFEINMFSTTFKATTGLDLMGYLKSFLDDEDLAEINRIIKNKKPA
jgi:hypothetical protein